MSNEESAKDLNNELQKYIAYYLKSYSKLPENTYPEFEVRFGSKKIKNISKLDFTNVSKILHSNNFKIASEKYSLKIINVNNLVQIRTEIHGFPNIQSYCKLNNLTGLLDATNINYVEKTSCMIIFLINLYNTIYNTINFFRSKQFNNYRYEFFVKTNKWLFLITIFYFVVSF